MMIPDKVYDVLKWVGLIFFPAMATLVGTVGPAWNVPHVDEIVLTLNAIGTCIGALIGATTLAYNEKFHIVSVEKDTVEKEVSDDD